MFLLWFTLIPPPGYPYPWMPLDLMLERSYNKKNLAPGPLWRFILRSYPPQNASIPPSTVNCLLPTLLSATSASCQKVDSFFLFTDHKPLTYALFRTSPPWSAMQQRRLSFLSEFNCEILHLPGPENVVADALSRPEPR